MYMAGVLLLNQWVLMPGNPVMDMDQIQLVHGHQLRQQNELLGINLKHNQNRKMNYVYVF